MTPPLRRSSCPIACTLDVLGDRWTLLVVRDLLLGMERFEQFLDSPEGIATNILADRLKRLEEARLVERRQSPNHRTRGTYHLTEKGQGLRTVVRAVVDWGLQNLPGTRVPPKAKRPEPTR